MKCINLQLKRGKTNVQKDINKSGGRTDFSVSGKLRSFQTASCKTVLDSGFQVLESGFLVSGIWIPDSNRKLYFGFLELNNEFQSKEFQIPKAEISWIRNGFHKQKLPGFRNPE